MVTLEKAQCTSDIHCEIQKMLVSGLYSSFGTMWTLLFSCDMIPLQFFLGASNKNLIKKIPVFSKTGQMFAFKIPSVFNPVLLIELVNWNTFHSMHSGFIQSSYKTINRSEECVLTVTISFY